MASRRVFSFGKVKAALEETIPVSNNEKLVPEVTCESRPKPEVKDLEKHTFSIQKWIEKSINEKEDRDESKQVCDDWKALTEIFKHCYADAKPSVVSTLMRALSTISRTQAICESTRRWNKDELNHCHVCTEALHCVTAILTSMNLEIDAGLMDEEFMQPMQRIFQDYIDKATSIFLRVDVHTRCALLDVIAALGRDIFCSLKDGWQKRVMIFVLGYADDKDLQAPIRAKFGRCIAKMIEFPPMREDIGFLVDSFSVTKRNIIKGESTVKISYAWTFANLTDALVDTYMDVGLEDKCKSFLIDLLETAYKSTEVPPRGRYSACRGCGNIYQWLKLEMLNNPDYQGFIKLITSALISMIGNGLDYKVRWNAARAVGYALENEVFVMKMEDEVTLPIVKSLTKWIAQSQNYKERIQCVLSLGRVNHRRIYGDVYPTLWERLCLAATRLPVEDSENMEKFKIEVLLLLFHLTSMISLNDLEAIGDTIRVHNELLTSLVLECNTEVPLERVGVVIAARDNLEILSKKTNATSVVTMLSSIMSKVTLEADG